MKKLITILFLLFITHTTFAQDDQQPGAARLKEKMIEFIQTKLGLSKAEAERFQPVFMDYLREMRKIKDERDPLIRQQKAVDIRIRFRDQWKPIVGEKRSNEVFNYEKEFVQHVREIRDERIQEHNEGPANKRKDH